MAGEGDQTKWVGIRPVNPAENIPVTESDPITEIDINPAAGMGTLPVAEQSPLSSIQVEPKAGAADLKVTVDGEVIHVIIDSGGAVEKTVGSLNGRAIWNSSTTAGTWITVKTFSGAGYINSISVGSPANVCDSIHFKLEIDGDTPVDLDLAILARAYGKDSGGNQRYGVTLPMDLRFETGFEFTFMDDVGGGNFTGGITYCVDQ